jgi:triosephosphate isomerase
MKKVVLNLKMNMTLEEIKSYEIEISKICNHNPEVIICPSYPFLHLFTNTNYFLGSQDVSQFIEGGYTGEVSARQVASIGAKYTIINHSERKKVANVSDDIILSKIRNALNANLKVVLCVGETYEEKRSGRTNNILINKIIRIFNQLNREDIKNIIVAYEPEWAIGSGIPAGPQEINELSGIIKQEVFRNFNKEIEVLYGGSVNSYNITNLVNMFNIDGFLLGKASVDLKEVNDILLMCKEKY